MFMYWLELEKFYFDVVIVIFICVCNLFSLVVQSYVLCFCIIVVNQKFVFIYFL